MNDWKGTKVVITIWRDGDWTEPVDEIDTYLDTDTMSDLFTKYSPVRHQFDITPIGDEDTEDYDTDGAFFIASSPRAVPAHGY